MEERLFLGECSLGDLGEGSLGEMSRGDSVGLMLSGVDGGDVSLSSFSLLLGLKVFTEQ
jgi:hypothetical protein